MSSILDKIRQLRELSTSSNINEATAAAAAADRLISKHRISEAEIEVANTVASLPAEEDSISIYESARIIGWKNTLACILAEHYGCTIYNSYLSGASKRGRGISRLKLVGVKDDMEITRYMFSWLVLEIDRLCKSHCAGLGHIYGNSYCRGAVEGIREQLNKIKQEQKSAAIEAGQTTALACLDERLGKADMALRTLHKNLKLEKKYTHNHINNDAYDFGKSVGNNIHLGKVIGEGSSVKMIK